MTEKQMGLKLAASECGISTSQESFEDRLILQKAIYILQVGGINFGYKFSWYIKGPYCPDLTYDAFDSKSEAVPNDRKLSQSTITKIKSLDNVFIYLNNFHPQDIKARAYERVGSILFAIYTGQSDANNPTEIQERMEKAGKPYSLDEVKATISLLKTNGLVH